MRSLLLASLALCSTILVAPAARAQDGGVAAIGPDVTVSTISQMTKYGTVGTTTAYAMTTVSCNLGDQVAIWIDCSSGSNCNQHPVIGSNLYRLKSVSGATRFEQLGLSWLKHGYCGADASSSSTCAPSCSNDGTCDSLGVGCTDTYGAGLNANQSDLGPRSEVNPFSGVFPYPYVRGSPTNYCTSNGGAICKRMQVKNADLDPAQNTGARYFGEGHYVCTDEGSAQRYNNVSHREVLVGSLSGGGYNLSFVTAATVQRKAAIESWPLIDAGAVVIPVDVSGDGRLFVGYKVTNKGGGIWHYEYAIYNMNCDRGVQAFTVPAPDWLDYSAIEFHDVDYHSGEPYSGADWVGAPHGSEMMWSSETITQNTNANALRWGTLYNFRFDANAPPTSRNATLGLFKSGTPGTVSAAIQAPRPVGDCNCDGLFNNFDIDAFVVAVLSPANFATTYPGCDINNADIDFNGAVDNFDIDPFITKLLAQ